MLLKEIPGVLPSLENTAISRSKLWERDVSEIIPHQLAALRWLANDRAESEGGEEGVSIDLYLDYLMAQLHEAKNMEIIPEDLPILRYSRPRVRGVLTSDLIVGLKAMSKPMARATIFGLEMDLPLDRIMTLSYKQANGMENLTPAASRALNEQVRSIRSQLAFWEETAGGFPGPIFGMANEIYTCFNMTWNTLRIEYKRRIPDIFDSVDNK